MHQDASAPRERTTKILFLAGHQGSGVAHIDKFLPTLASGPYEVTFLGWDRERTEEKTFERDGIQFRMIQRGWGYANRWLALALPLWVIVAFWHLLIRRPDVVMASDFDSGLPAAMAKFFTRTPLVYIILDTFSMRPFTPNLLRGTIEWLDRRVIAASDRVIVPDDTRIQPDYPNLDRFVIVYNSCPDKWSEVPEEQHLASSEDFTILACGYLRENRGVKLLTEVARRRPDIKFLLAGYLFDDDIQKDVDELDNIDFIGRVPYTEALTLPFRVNAVFTFYDPSSMINRLAASNKWFDAMMAARPIIVNEELVKAEWIRERDIGFLCPYGNIDALEACLVDMKENSAEAIRKGKNGRKLYEDGLSWSAMEDRIHEIVADVARNN